MSEVHAQARTTPRTRAEIKESSASLAELAERYNISRAPDSEPDPRVDGIGWRT